MRRIRIPANGMEFDASEDGPAGAPLVLLLHGFPESSHEWDLVAPQVAAAGYHVVAPDQRGYSPNARPDGVEAYHVRHLGEDVLAIADHFGADRFHVVGHDWGALVAWSVAGRTPDRVSSLTALSVPHPVAFADARTNDPEQREKSSYIPHLKAEGSEAMFAGEDGSVSLAFSEVAPDLLAHHSRVLSSPGAMTAALNYYRAWDAYLDETPVVTVPTLFVWSTDDVALGRVPAEATHRYVDAPYRFEVVDGESHWLPEVVPDTITALLLEHLAAHR